MEVDSHTHFSYNDEQPGLFVDECSKNQKKRPPNVSVVDYEVERVGFTVSALQLDSSSGNCQSYDSSSDEDHILDLPASMIPFQLRSSTNMSPYQGLGDLCPELHHRICSFLPTNDIWNLSRCNRAMSVSFPSSITTFHTRGVSSRAITEQLGALRRAPLLRKLTIQNFRSTSQHWAAELVVNCPHLKRLTFINCNVTVLAYAALAFLKELLSLEILNAQMDDFHMLFSPRVLSVLSSPVAAGSYSGSSSAAGAAIPNANATDIHPTLFASLEYLSVVPMRTYELAIIVSHLPGLRKLKATLESEDKPSKRLALACASLNSLTLNTTYSDKPMQMQFIKTFKNLKMLKTLDLSTGVDDNNISALCDNLKSLTTLRIKSAHNLGEIGLDSIRTLPRLRILFIDFGIRVFRRPDASLLAWILRFRAMTSLAHLTFLLPDSIALSVVHGKLLESLQPEYLQLGSTIFSRSVH